MSLTLGVLTETAPSETRVACTPDAARKWIQMGLSVRMETGAGARAGYDDAAYNQAGVILSDRRAVLDLSDALMTLRPPPESDINLMKSGAAIIGLMNGPEGESARHAGQARDITLLAMEKIPRISRAQAMDVLSSQSSLAGYRAVIEASAIFPRAFPMMMTAAGTIPPARVFVMGAGVAGLQAIATARRLGAITSATDVRCATREQVESLGAKFIMAPELISAQTETSGGYARDIPPDIQEKQTALVAQTIGAQDIVITTALIPGRPAPRLVTTDMIRAMKAGSILVDMSTSQGGNIEGSQIDEVITTSNGVTIIGYQNLAARVPYDASALYARNLTAFLGLIYNTQTGAFHFNLEDDIIKAVLVS